MYIPTPRTVKEAAAILAEAQALAFTKKSAEGEEPWYTFPGVQKWVGDQAKSLGENYGRGAMTGAFTDKGGNLTPFAQTLAGGAIGAGVGGLGGLATGMSRKQKRPVGDMLTGALIGGAGGAGIGAALGYGGQLNRPGEGERSNSLHAGASALHNASTHNSAGLFPGQSGVIANQTRALANLPNTDGSGLANVGAHAVNPANLLTSPDKYLPSPVTTALGFGGAYAGHKGQTAISNLLARTIGGNASERGWKGMHSALNSPGAVSPFTSKGLTDPTGAARELINLAATKKTIPVADLTNLLGKGVTGYNTNTAAQEEFNKLRTEAIEARTALIKGNAQPGLPVGQQLKPTWLSRVGLGAPKTAPIPEPSIPAAKLRDYLVRNGVGGIGAGKLKEYMTASLPKATPSIRGALGWTLGPAAVAHGLYSMNNAGRLRDLASEFAAQQPATIRSDPDALANAYIEANKAYGTTAEADPTIIARLRALAGE